MKLDWALDIFKGLVVAGATWCVIYLRKQAKPFYKKLQKSFKLIETTEELKEKVALLESKQLALYEIMRDPIFTVDENGAVDYANAAWTKLGGFPDKKDGYGYGWIEMIAEEDKEKIEKISERMNEHPSQFPGIIRIKNLQTGNTFITECRTAFIYNWDNKFVGALVRLYIIKEELPK